MTTQTVELEHADLRKLLAQRTADEILTTQAGKPLARVLPIVENANERKPLPHGNDTPSRQPAFHVARPGDAMSQEVKAFEAQFEGLKEKYLGKHIAMFQGEVVDFDDDGDALLSRINWRYPDDQVLMRKVQSNLPGEIRIRSTRLLVVSEASAGYDKQQAYEQGKK